MYVGHVQGGTNAGWRTVREQRTDWNCPNCNARNRYYWVNCPSCLEHRPEEED
jgi:hypothetical protein